MTRKPTYMPRYSEMRSRHRPPMRHSNRRNISMGYFMESEPHMRTNSTNHKHARRDYMATDNEYSRNTNKFGSGYEEHDPQNYGYDEDYGDYDYEYGYDYNDMPKLTKQDIMEWKHKLVNADGSKGEHFKMENILKAAKDMGIRFHEYDERELCLTVNMLYSDYCEVLKPFISPDRELYAYVALGKAFLEDEDAPEGSEKLALYYYCIVDAE